MSATDGAGFAPIDHATDPVHSDFVIDDPLALAAAWLPANNHPDRPRVTLTTNGRDGYPNARTVLLTEFTGGELYVHTDSRSDKAAELRADPRATVVILWPSFTRQLVMTGDVRVAPATELSRAYADRSPYLQQLAWLNDGEYAMLPLADREDAWASFAADQADASPAAPATWTGFALRPVRLRFWVSHPGAASRRIEYSRADGSPTGWDRRYLPG